MKKNARATKSSAAVFLKRRFKPSQLNLSTKGTEVENVMGALQGPAKA